MKRQCAFLIMSWLFVFAAPPLYSQPLASLRYTAYADFDVASLSPDGVEDRRVRQVDLPIAMSVETLFFIPANVAKVAGTIREWNPARHKALNIVTHGKVSNPAKAEDFSGLNLSEDVPGHKTFLSQLSSIREAGGPVFMSHAEAETIRTKMETAPSRDTNAAGGEWRAFLLNRAGQFQKAGLAGSAGYESKRGAFFHKDQLPAVLNRVPSVKTHFEPVLKRFESAQAADSGLNYYWENLTLSGKAVFVLGAVASAELGTNQLLADLQYYVSGDYFSTLILYDLAPITIDGKAGCLVWRGDYVMSPALAIARGNMERMVSAKLMTKEIKNAIDALRSEFKSPNP